MIFIISYNDEMKIDVSWIGWYKKKKKVIANTNIMEGVSINNIII